MTNSKNERSLLNNTKMIYICLFIFSAFLGKDLAALEYLDGITLDLVLKHSRS